MSESLLKETLESLKNYNKHPADVFWVGSCDGAYKIGWSEFAEIADFEYDSGYGGQEIARDLVVVGNDWWLERGEYDGSEWWEFKRMPQLTAEPMPFNKLIGDGIWKSIETLESKEVSE